MKILLLTSLLLFGACKSENEIIRLAKVRLEVEYQFKKDCKELADKLSISVLRVIENEKFELYCHLFNRKTNGDYVFQDYSLRNTLNALELYDIVLKEKK